EPQFMDAVYRRGAVTDPQLSADVADVLTVLAGRDSSPAMSGRDKFVGSIVASTRSIMGAASSAALAHIGATPRLHCDDGFPLCVTEVAQQTGDVVQADPGDRRRDDGPGGDPRRQPVQ